MIPQVGLPFDVWELIVITLGDEIDLANNTTTLPLKSLSLTCKSMVPLCRKHLFWNLNLDDPKPSQRFITLLSDNPEIVLYFRRLRFRIYDPFNSDTHQILEALKNRSTALQSISLWSSAKSWDTFPPSLQILLDQLIHFPSVTELELLDIARIPATIFAGSTNLNNITLRMVDFIFPNSQVIRPAGKPTPQHLTVEEESYSAIHSLIEPPGLDQDETIIDFAFLKGLSFSISRPGDTDIIWKVLQLATSVQSLRLHTHGRLPWAGLGAALRPTRPISISTLRILEISTWVNKENYTPLCDLIAELQLLAGMNGFEEISLDIIFSNSAESLPDTVTEDWSSFDSLITTSGSFPLLKSVSVAIYWCTSRTDPENHVHPIQEEDFPMLLNSKAVKFKFSVEYYYEWDFGF